MSEHSPRSQERNEDSHRNGRNHSNERRPRNRSGSGDRDKRDKNPETFTQIYVAKLHKRTREDDLKEQFSKFGRVKEIVFK